MPGRTCFRLLTIARKLGELVPTLACMKNRKNNSLYSDCHCLLLVRYTSCSFQFAVRKYLLQYQGMSFVQCGAGEA